MSIRPLARQHWVPVVFLVVSVGLFYALQFGSNATIHWDAVDVHYSSQAYLSAQVRAGSLPFWTTALFSGFPFLADPQVGALVPAQLAVLAGRDHSAQLEVVVHVLIACLGAYALAWQLIHNRHGGLLGLDVWLIGVLCRACPATRLSLRPSRRIVRCPWVAALEAGTTTSTCFA